MEEWDLVEEFFNRIQDPVGERKKRKTKGDTGFFMSFLLFFPFVNNYIS